LRNLLSAEHGTLKIFFLKIVKPNMHPANTQKEKEKRNTQHNYPMRKRKRSRNEHIISTQLG
jgi:hypothetical protein